MKIKHDNNICCVLTKNEDHLQEFSLLIIQRQMFR